MQQVKPYWGVWRANCERKTPQESAPLVTYPALSGSSYWLAQSAMQALRRATGLRLYIDLGESE